MASRYTSIRKAEPRLWRIWYRMNRRCEDNERGYEDVEVHEDYSKDISGEQGFVNFADDFWDTYQDDLSIDRINPAGNYEYTNMRWATPTQQNRNTRFHKLTERGRMLTEMHKRWGHSVRTKQRFWSRLQRGWSYEDTINIPPSYGNRMGQSSPKARHKRLKSNKTNTIWSKLRSII